MIQSFTEQELEQVLAYSRDSTLVQAVKFVITQLRNESVDSMVQPGVEPHDRSYLAGRVSSLDDLTARITQLENTPKSG